MSPKESLYQTQESRWDSSDYGYIKGKYKLGHWVQLPCSFCTHTPWFLSCSGTQTCKGSTSVNATCCYWLPWSMTSTCLSVLMILSDWLWV